MKMIYWCNANFRNKYFGYKDIDELVYVGAVDADNLDDMYRQCNRIDEAVPMLDEALAPSMSVGDVVQIIGNPDEWFAVASFGFDKIEAPKKEYLVTSRKAGEGFQRGLDG